MEAFVNYLFRLPRMILLLSLIALACLPIALSNLVRDASASLLLPVTLFGALLAWGLAKWHLRKISVEIILLFLGPLALFVRIGQLGGSLFELIKQTIVFIPPMVNRLYQKTPFDPYNFVSASDDLKQRILTFGGRLFLWFSGVWQGIQVEDPVVRTLIWSIGLWLIAVWAGWQISSNKRLLVGMLPATILMALVLDYTGKEIWILWLHLSLLLFLYGMSSYTNLRDRWNIFRIDYSDSTSFDTLILVTALTVGLVFVSSIVSAISFKGIFENFRATLTASNEARTKSLGLEPAKENQVATGISSSIPSSYTVGPGPELSDDLVMVISTGDLPPMPMNAHPSVQNYHWRTMTYQNYTGSGWRNPSTFTENFPPNTELIEPPYPNYRVVHQEVTFPNETSKSIYWTGTLISAEVPFQAIWIRKSEKDPLLESDMLAAIAAVKSYRADSLLFNVSAQELRNSPGVYPDWVRGQFLGLPDSVPERVLALGRDLSASGRTPYDRAIAIQNYLREFPYSLDVPAPPAGRDVADFFLFDLKKGYCDYYATTMVVLARAAGLPARIVIGYASGSYDVEQARYFVTENNAHAWVEIYFTGIGWVEFEPTANQPAIEYADKNKSDTVTQSHRPKESIYDQFRVLFNRAVRYAWLSAIFLFLFVLIWIRWDYRYLTYLEPSQSIQLIYRRFRRFAHPVNRMTSMHQTVHAYASALNTRMSSLVTQSRIENWLSPSKDEINQLTELYSRSLFAPISPTRVEVRSAIKAWSRLQWRLVLANVIVIKDHLLRPRQTLGNEQ